MVVVVVRDGESLFLSPIIKFLLSPDGEKAKGGQKSKKKMWWYSLIATSVPYVPQKKGLKIIFAVFP